LVFEDEDFLQKHDIAISETESLPSVGGLRESKYQESALEIEVLKLRSLFLASLEICFDIEFSSAC